MNAAKSTSAKTSDNTRPASAQLRVGMVGGGFFAQFHIDAWNRIPETLLIALADPAPAKREAAASTTPGLQTFNSLTEMLQSGDLDLIDIATPPTTHVALVKEAFAAGLPIVCQKPFCTNLTEAKALTNAASKAGVTLVVHENFRFEPWYRETKRLLDTNLLGDVYQISFRMRPGDGQGPDAYLARQPYFQKMPRFLIRETGIHFIDVFRYLLGPITAVTADLRRLNPVIEGEDSGLVLFQFAAGQRGLFDANRLVDHISDNRRRTMGEMMLEGSKATLRLDGYGRLFIRNHGENTETEHIFPWDDIGYGGDCVKLCLAHIAKAVKEGKRPENQASEYLENLMIEDAIYRSNEKQATIVL